MSKKAMVSKFEDWTDTSVIRQWWYLYRYVLEHSNQRVEAEFKEIDDEIERRQISKNGHRMTREGAEDLAALCDDARKKKIKHGY